MMKHDDFLDKIALVTGASSGIGADTAVSLAACGASIIAHYNSNVDGATRVLKQIRDAGGEASLMKADLSCQQGVRDLVKQIKTLPRPINILVNNAGSLIERSRVLEFTEELWDEVMTLNLKSTFFITQAVLPGMMAQKSGCIVNISSVAALFGGGIGAAAYATAKGGVSTLTKALAREFAPHGIRVNAVSPGTIDTSYHRTFSTKEGLDAVVAATPAGRLGVPRDIADAILFLCSAQAQFIHGQIIEVNGGFCMT